MKTKLKTFNKTDKRVFLEKLEKLKSVKEVILSGIEGNQRRMDSGTFVRVRNAALKELKAIDNMIQIVFNA